MLNIKIYLFYDIYYINIFLYTHIHILSILLIWETLLKTLGFTERSGIFQRENWNSLCHMHSFVYWLFFFWKEN